MFGGQGESTSWLTLSTTDPSLRDLTYKIVTLATYHDAIQTFVEAYSHLTFGLTSHALCSGIRQYINVCAEVSTQTPWRLIQNLTGCAPMLGIRYLDNPPRGTFRLFTILLASKVLLSGATRSASTLPDLRIDSRPHYLAAGSRCIWRRREWRPVR